MKGKRTKIKEADTKKVESDVNDVEPSRLTVHDSRLTVFTDSWFHMILIIVAGLLVYSNTLHVPFQFDDFVNLTDNPVIKSLGNFISSTKGYDYNPRRFIGYLTFALNYHFGGLDVTGYHIVNIAIHIANSILVYFLVVLTFRTPFFRFQGPGTRDQDSKSVNLASGYQWLVPGPSSLVPFFSALLFAVHPIQTEAVTYIVQRFASLAAMFYLMSVVAYIKARLMGSDDYPSPSPLPQGEGVRGRVSSSRFTFFAISFISAVLAMATKENAFTLPVIIILYEFCFFSRSSRLTTHVSRLTFLIPILLTMLIIPLTILGTHRPLGEIISDMGERLRAQSYLPRWDYLMTQLRVITTYIRLIFLPVNQNLDYDYPVYHSFFSLPVILSFIFLAALLGLGVYLVKQAKVKVKVKVKVKAESLLASSQPQPLPQPAFRLIGFGILWFFITLSVESSFIPIADVIVEHRLYLPLAGALIAITTSAFIFWEKLAARSEGMGKALIIALSLITVAFSAAAFARNMVWQDQVRLWEDITLKSPDKPRAHDLLGTAYLSRNMTDKALEQYMIAVKLSPAYAEAHYNLGRIYQSRSMFVKAMEQYLIAIKLKPDYAEPHNNLGNIYQALNMPDKAMEQYLIAIQLKPDYVMAHNNLGFIYQSLNMPDKAVSEFQTVVNLMPDTADAHFNLGLVYYNLGQLQKARTELLAVLKINPSDAQAQQLLNTVNR